MPISFEVIKNLQEQLQQVPEEIAKKILLPFFPSLNNKENTTINLKDTTPNHLREIMKALQKIKEEEFVECSL